MTSDVRLNIKLNKWKCVKCGKFNDADMRRCTCGRFMEDPSNKRATEVQGIPTADHRDVVGRKTGLLDLLMGGKQVKELTCAFVGGYVYSRLPDDRRKSVMGRTVISVCEYHSSRISYDQGRDIFDNSPGIVQIAFMVNAMIDMGIHHGVQGFQWDYISNPFALSAYPERAIDKAASNLSKYGIDPNDCFAEPI